MADEKDIQPTAGVAGEQTGSGQQAGVDQATLNRIEKKWRHEAQAAKKEAEELKAKLDEFENARKSEQEKAIEAARKDAMKQRDEHWSGLMRQKDIDATVERVAVVAGVHEDFIPSLKAKLGDVSDPTEISDAVKKVIDANPHFRVVGRQAVTGQMGMPSGLPQTNTWTLERIQSELVARKGRGFTDSEWQEIKKANLR